MCGKMKRARLSSQVRKTFRGSTRGFTLIEVVIAIAILGTIAITFLGALSTSSLALITADQRATAESLARSQMEFVKNQGYNSTLVGGQATYPKIPGIPDGYYIYSVNSNNQTVNGNATAPVIGIAWNSTLNKPVTTNTGLQMIALVIKYQGQEIYTFINDNPNWANGVKITLEGYIRQPVT
jgi:prepilin-type N-terminal cleavage/methylation domain-containing protein